MLLTLDLCLGKWRNCIVQACRPKGPRIKTVTVGCGSWSLPKGSSSKANIVAFSATKYRKRSTAVCRGTRPPGQLLQCFRRDTSSRSEDRDWVPHALGKYPTCENKKEEKRFNAYFSFRKIIDFSEYSIFKYFISVNPFRNYLRSEIELKTIRKKNSQSESIQHSISD